MTIGLFLDVDNTLTRGFIQHNYAKMIGVENDYLEIEQQYESNALTSEAFGDKLIELFNQTKFDSQFAKDNFGKIKLKDSAGPLLKCQSLSIRIYFVSAGPNYYVLRLAEKYNIPAENVLCSEYHFDSQGKLEGCDAVTPQQKRDFRVQHASGHDLTIGVGDDEIHDASFLDGCDIGLLTPKSGQAGRAISDNHLWAPRLSLVLALVTNFDWRLKASANRLGRNAQSAAAEVRTS
jgi:phosphoserine phosphatase